ncbi:MAG: EamA family transporter [Verrucomicrobiota bacterium]
MSLRSTHNAPAPAWLVMAAFASVYLIWGSTYLGIRIAIETMPPFLMGAVRFLLAGLILYPVMRLCGAKRPEPVHWRSAFIIGALMILVGNGGVTWAELTVPSGVAALMIAAVPFWMVCIEALRPNGNRPGANAIMGLVLGFAGVSVLIGPGSLRGAGEFGVGIWAVLVATLGWSLGSIYSRHAPQPESRLLSVAMQMIAGALCQFVVAGAAGEFNGFQLAQVSTRSWWAFAYLTLVGSLVAFTAYVWLLKVSTPTRVSSYAYVNPLIAIVLGTTIGGEPFNSRCVLAAVLILGAVVLITTAPVSLPWRKPRIAEA